MNEDQNDQTTGEAVNGSPTDTPTTGTPPTEVPETTGAAAIPMPAATAPATEEPLPLPQQPQPDTPPMGIPQGSGTTPPQGTYAMGALAGNPMLGDAPASPLGGPPPTDPGVPMWSAPPAPAAAAGSTHHRIRNGLLAGAAALAVLGAGIGIGHATSNNGPSTQALAPSSGGGRVPSGSGGGSGSGNPFGNGSPFGGAFGGSGNSANGNSGSSNSGGPSDADAIASKVDPGLVDINTTLGYQQEQAAGTGIVLTSNGEILTNNHVINGATSISVTDVGNHKTYTASVVGYDRSEGHRGPAAAQRLGTADGDAGQLVQRLGRPASGRRRQRRRHRRDAERGRRNDHGPQPVDHRERPG